MRNIGEKKNDSRVRESSEAPYAGARNAGSFTFCAKKLYTKKHIAPHGQNNLRL